MSEPGRPGECWIDALDPAAAERAFALIESTEAGGATSATTLPSIDGYVVDRMLGEGAGGTVYLAFRRGSDRAVAIKLLTHPLGRTLDAKRAWRELDLLEQLQHPSIPRLLDYGVHEGRMYLVTEFIDGRPLDEYLAHDAAGLERRVELLADVADVVQALNERGVIHRDVKPANVLIDTDGRPVLIDLGIAKLLTRGVVDTLTREGAPLGSPAFMAPEQVRGESVSTRTDVYGLGATAFLLLTGETPHDLGGTVHEALRTIAEEPPRHPLAVRPGLPRALAAVVAKAIAVVPEHRYGSAGEFAADLRRWRRREPVEAGSLPWSYRVARTLARHPKAATTAVCLAIALLTVVSTFASVWWLSTRPHHLKVDPVDGAWVQLVARTGHALEEWDTESPGGVLFTRLVNRPRTAGGGKIVLLGFSTHPDDRMRGQLCAFDFDEPETLLWSSGNGPPEIEMPPPISNVGNNRFVLQLAHVTEVFAESPGPEIIAAHRMYRWSPAVIRVYALDGRVLYEVWHDGTVNAVHWMRQRRLLVCSGYNSEGNWSHRGHGNLEDLTQVPWPVVVFAIQPTVGTIHRAWIKTAGGGGTVEPAWYECLHPPEAVGEVLGSAHAFGVGWSLSAGSASTVAEFWMAPSWDSRQRLTFTFDAEGRVVDRMISDVYRLDERLPDPDGFFFDDLPPRVVESRPETGADG